MENRDVIDYLADMLEEHIVRYLFEKFTLPEIVLYHVQNNTTFVAIRDEHVMVCASADEEMATCISVALWRALKSTARNYDLSCKVAEIIQSVDHFSMKYVGI